MNTVRSPLSLFCFLGGAALGASSVGAQGYVGAQGGIIASVSRTSAHYTASGRNDYDHKGLTGSSLEGGVFLGADMTVWRRLFCGVMLDAATQKLSGSYRERLAVFNNHLFSIKLSCLFAGSLRLGWHAFPALDFYLKSGLSYGRWKASSQNLTVTGQSVVTTKYRPGVLVGAGFDCALSKKSKWMWGAQANLIYFSSMTIDNSATIAHTTVYPRTWSVGLHFKRNF